MSEIQVHIPIDVRDVPPMALAPRKSSLNGLRIGLLDNGKEFTDLVMEGLAEALEAENGVKEVVFWRKGFPSKAAPFIEQMASAVDVAVSGVGH
jgi:hypothetical protein